MINFISYIRFLSLSKMNVTWSFIIVTQMPIVSIAMRALTVFALMDTQVMVLLNAGTSMNVSPKRMIVDRLKTVSIENPDMIAFVTIFPSG